MFDEEWICDVKVGRVNFDLMCSIFLKGDGCFCFVKILR